MGEAFPQTQIDGSSGAPPPGRDRSRLAQILLASAGGLCLAAGAAVLWWEPFRRIVVEAIAAWKGTPPAPDWPVKISSMSVEALLAGLLLLGMSFAAGSGAKVVRWIEARARWVTAASGALLLGIWLPVILGSRGVTLAGERFWWLFDDGMISMRFARNLARGAGLVWNPGERVEGYSNFLWTLWMAAVHLLPIPDSKTSLVILLTNVVLGLASLAALARLVRSLDGGALAAAGSLLAFAVSRDIAYWATGGLEMTLATLIVLTACFRLLDEARAARPRLATYFLISLLPLVRADGFVLAGLLFALSLALNPERRKVLAFAAASLVLPASHEIFRIAYYGDLLSNTAYLKTLHWSGRYAAGVRQTVLFGVQYAPLLLLALLATRGSSRRSRRLLLALVALFGGYVAYVGGDAFQNYRFFVPVLPLMVVLAFRAIEDVPGGEGVRVALAALVILPMMVPNYSIALFRNTNDQDNVKIGLLLKANTAPDCRVADAYAGSVFYFSGRYGIDFLGKSDRHIAHDVVAVEGRRGGHNKFDYDYSLGRLKPDVVVAMFRLPEDRDSMEAESHGDTPFVGQLYFNPIFREHCLPNPVSVPTPRSIFVCDWSAEMNGRGGWRAAPYFEEAPPRAAEFLLDKLRPAE
jgi:hypothetical protein